MLCLCRGAALPLGGRPVPGSKRRSRSGADADRNHIKRRQNEDRLLGKRSRKAAG